MPDRLTAIGLGALIAVSVVGCANLMRQAGPAVTVTEAFDRLPLSTPSGKMAMLAVTALEQDGKARVCAAFGLEGAPDASADWIAAVLRAASVYINGELIQTGVPFASITADQSDLIGAEAKCMLSATKWKPDYTGVKARVGVGEIRI